MTTPVRSSQASDATDGAGGGEGATGDNPTDLPLVGPATAAAIDDAPFDATDIADRRVSYRMLREAGVNPGIAARMRRRYSLVWSFRWHFGGDDFPDRAAQVRGLRDPERAWIDESGRPVEDTSPELEAWADWIDGSFENGTSPPSERQCPRCGSPFSTFVMGTTERIHCEGCGYAAVEISRESHRGGPEESWRTALERFRSRTEKMG